MHHRSARHTVAVLLASAVSFGPGLGERRAAAAEGIEEPQAAVGAAEKRADIVRAGAEYAGRGSKPVFERPACHREFAGKAIRVGVGVAAHEIRAQALIRAMGRM
ncbi:hypothetical protein [Streptomyces massasporeus]|uniref:hypothetical protein n=1 Tax=Streptomyces massasporeus TaxID=67324 RepID=UPI003803A8C0